VMRSASFRTVDVVADGKGLSSRAMGCKLAQGFYMGEPTPVNAVVGLLDMDFQTAHGSANGGGVL
jgi:hypothetical protein